MRAPWSAMPSQARLIQRKADDLRDLEVIEEFNGPQIVFATLDGERLFGVAADEDEAWERWVFAPVGSSEERALRAGVASPREALRKETARIVDFARDGSGLRVTPVDGAELADDELPTPKARLEPEGPLAAPKPGQVGLTLDREGGGTRGLPFDAVADVLRAVQRYANAVGAYVDAGLSRLSGRFSDELLGKTALTLQAASPGSLRLEVIPGDAALSKQMMEHLARTIEASDDREQLVSLADHSGPRALRRYEDLLIVLERYQLQLLAQGDGVSSFVDWRSAARFSRAKPPSVEREPEPIVARGYFSGYFRDKREFAFVDQEHDAPISGEIAPSVLDDNEPVTVHEDALYLIELGQTSVRTPGAKERRRYLLTRIIEPVPR